MADGMADGMDEAVNHPAHYNVGAVEVIDAIEAWGLGFHLGNAVKYIARAEHKGTRLQDLRKARWYIDREIARSEHASADEYGCLTCGLTQAEHTGQRHVFTACEPLKADSRDAGAGPCVQCCPKCATPHHDAGSYTMLRCASCDHVWERSPVEAEHG